MARRPIPKRQVSRMVNSNFSELLKHSNKNPLLRQRMKLLSDMLSEERDIILEEGFKEVDKCTLMVSDYLKNLDEHEDDTILGLARRNKEFIPTLRVYITGDGEPFTSLSFKLINLVNSREEELHRKMYNISKLPKLRETYKNFHDRTLKNNLRVLKSVANEEMDTMIEGYLYSEGFEDNDNLMDIEESAIDIDKKIDKSFINRSYKEINKLVEENGYTFDRQRGDHAIYKNKDGYITVVPQRTIGKGLQLEILKQIGIN